MVTLKNKLKKFILAQIVIPTLDLFYPVLSTPFRLFFGVFLTCFIVTFSQPLLFAMVFNIVFLSMYIIIIKYIRFESGVSI